MPHVIVSSILATLCAIRRLFTSLAFVTHLRRHMFRHKIGYDYVDWRRYANTGWSAVVNAILTAITTVTVVISYEYGIEYVAITTDVSEKTVTAISYHGDGDAIVGGHVAMSLRVVREQRHCDNIVISTSLPPYTRRAEPLSTMLPLRRLVGLVSWITILKDSHEDEMPTRKWRQSRHITNMPMVTLRRLA